MTRHVRVTLLSSLIIPALLLSGCDDSGDRQPHAQIPQVSVYVVNSAPLSVTTELPGRTSAYRVAEVRPQVSGIILHRNFVEGSDVAAGQSLSIKSIRRPIRQLITAQRGMKRKQRPQRLSPI